MFPLADWLCWRLEGGKIQSLAVLGGAPSIFLMVLPDLFRVRLEDVAGEGEGEGDEGGGGG